MYKSFVLSVLLLFTLNTFAQTLISKELLVSYSKQQIDSTLTANGIPTAIFSTKYGIDAYKLLYNTQDFDSTNKVASGLMVVPKSVDCPLAIIKHSHGTTSVKEDVPTRLNGEAIVGMVSASNGYVSALPDYLGMGDSDWPHYYLHKHTQVMAAIDLLRAVKEACDELGVTLSDELFLTGYSQGGYSTMATHKYIETYFPNEFQVTRSFPGAGSYDKSGAMLELMLSDAPYSQPGYLPFLIFTWNAVYDFFEDYSEYVRSPYDTILPDMVDGTHSISQLNQVMPDTPKLMFHQHIIDSVANNPNHPLRLALYNNDVYRWVPQAPMTMIHCRDDNQVPVENTHNAYNYFIQNGAMYVDTVDLQPTASHGACAQLTYIYWKGFMDNIAAQDPCLTSVQEVKVNSHFSVYPNPAQEYIRLEFSQNLLQDLKTARQPLQLEVYDLSGRKCIEKQLGNFTNEHVLNIEKLIPGSYLLKISGAGHNFVEHFVVF